MIHDIETKLESRAKPCSVLQNPNCCGNMQKMGYRGNRGRLGSCLNDTITLPDPYNPDFSRRIWHLSPYKPNFSQFYVLSLPWQQGSVGGRFESPWNFPTSKTPVRYKNLGHVSYIHVVRANFLFKHPNLCYGHISLTAVLSYCKFCLLTSLVHTASEHQR